MDQYAKMCPVKEGDLIQVETRMSKGEVTFKVFDARNKLKASQTCGEIAFLNTFAVALGPVCCTRCCCCCTSPGTVSAVGPECSLHVRYFHLTST